MDWTAVVVGGWVGATVSLLIFWPESVADFWRNLRR